MALNNNQVATLVNAAVAQATGAEKIAQLDLSAIVDAGNDATVIGTKETFTKSLLNVVIKNWFTDTSYRGQYNDPFFIDSEEFGAIVQSLHMEYPSAEVSHAWNDFAPSEGVRKKVGTYDVYVPVINAQLYGKTISWEIPITITDEQWDTAFRDASELSAFVNYVYLMVDNSIVMHLESMNEANRNNFIAEKIAYSNSKNAVGVHVVNLVELYNNETGSSFSTAKAFMKDESAMRFAASKIDEFSDYLKKMSRNFNTAEYDRFTPKDRQVCLVLTDFDKRVRTVAMANTFNPEYISLPNYDTVAAWQSTGSYGFDEVSAIHVKTATGETVKEDGIVAFLADKYACLHTIKNRRVAVKVFEPEALTTTFNQFRDQYSNDLTQNAVVFVVKDITAEDIPAEEEDTKA